MRLYLAGPMRGRPRLNFDEFDRIAAFLRVHGHDVVNPADLSRRLGVDPDRPETQSSVRECLLLDVQELFTCEAIVLLPGWHTSMGAKAEYWLAKAVGMVVYELRGDELCLST